MNVTPEELAAFADGELEGAAAQSVAAAVAADPVLQAQVEAHRALRRRLADHFASIAAAPVPERLRQAALAEAPTAEVIDLPSAAARRRPPLQVLRYAMPALAASLVVAVLGFQAWRSNGYAQGALAVALDQQLATSAPAQAPVRVLLSFRDGTGQYCRAFAAAADSGIACHDERGWRLVRTGAAAVGQQTEYRQAGSAEAALMAQAQAMAAGPALDAEEEAAAVRRGWRR